MSDTQTVPGPASLGADRSGPTTDPKGGYSHEHRPLAGYSVLTGIFGVAFTSAMVAAFRRRGGLPDRPDVFDVVTAGAATHKLARLIAKDKVTSFIRAPFVTFEEESGHGEVSEEPRGTGLRLATGELLVCPYCLSQWIASTIVVGYVGAPRFTRLMTFLYTAQTVADFTQLGYKAAENALDQQ